MLQMLIKQQVSMTSSYFKKVNENTVYTNITFLFGFTTFHSKILPQALLFKIIIDDVDGLKCLENLFDSVAPIALRPLDVILKAIFAPANLVRVDLSYNDDKCG